MKIKLVKTICALSAASLLISCQSKQVTDNKGLEHNVQATPEASVEPLCTPTVISTEESAEPSVEPTQQVSVTNTPTVDASQTTKKPESTEGPMEETKKPENSEEQYSSPAEAFQSVLKGETSFLNTDGTVEATYVTKIKRIAGVDIGEPLKADEFCIVDMDQDGEKEVVVRLSSGSEGYSVVLHYYNGQVYGYGFNLRAMGGITAKGLFNFSKGVKDSGWAQLVFEGTSVKTKIKAEYKNAESEYYVDGEEVSEEEFYSYSREKENEDEAPCYEMLDSNIVTYIKE